MGGYVKDKFESGFYKGATKSLDSQVSQCYGKGLPLPDRNRKIQMTRIINEGNLSHKEMVNIFGKNYLTYGC